MPCSLIFDRMFQFFFHSEWRRRHTLQDGQSYSHSMVPGGLLVMS